MTRQVPQWKIELRAATYPVEEWVTMQAISGRLYKFIERQDAVDAMEALKKIQPHATLRISPA